MSFVPELTELGMRPPPSSVPWLAPVYLGVNVLEECRNVWCHPGPGPRTTDMKHRLGHPEGGLISEFRPSSAERRKKNPFCVGFLIL